MGGNADDGGGLEGGEDILELTTENSPILGLANARKMLEIRLQSAR